MISAMSSYITKCSLFLFSYDLFYYYLRKERFRGIFLFKTTPFRCCMEFAFLYLELASFLSINQNMTEARENSFPGFCHNIQFLNKEYIHPIKNILWRFIHYD
ncbi:hypothetical protein ABD68_10710 [Bacillus endophyticus]|nr:hypothetical protein [Priestia endophytica]